MEQAYDLHNSGLPSVLCHHNSSAFIWPLTPAGGEQDPWGEGVNQLDVTSRWEGVPCLLPLHFPRARNKAAHNDLALSVYIALIEQELRASKTQPLTLGQGWGLPSTPSLTHTGVSVEQDKIPSASPLA